jgi:hypothetical protein
MGRIHHWVLGATASGSATTSGALGCQRRIRVRCPGAYKQGSENLGEEW